MFSSNGTIAECEFLLTYYDDPRFQVTLCVTFFWQGSENQLFYDHNLYHSLQNIFPLLAKYELCP